MTEHSLVRRSRTVVAKTRTATALTVRQRDARIVAVTVTVAYLLIYLWALGHLSPGLGGFGVSVVDAPFSKLFQPSLGPLSFTPVATVQVGPMTYLFSLNSILGLGLAALVGLNLGLTYLAWTQPRACGLGQSSTGVLASIPAVLSGTACCGPVVLIVLGIQASGVLLTTFQFLLPISVVLLVGSLALVGQQIEPGRLDGSR